MMPRRPGMMNFSEVSAMRLQLGKPVRCTDGVELELSDVVIDPTTRRVTHLVVQPHDRHDLARIVPVSLAEPAHGHSDAALELACSSAELEKLERVQRAAYLRLGQFPVEDPDYDVGIEETYALPYYGSFAPGGIDSGLGPVAYDENAPVIWDRIPKGEVEIRRGSAVSSSDGHHLGHIEGFLVDDDQHISDFVLEHGHLWGKREIVIPIGAVQQIESDGATLSITKDEVEKLQSRQIHRW
jgi:sporulation protein YlmC with PRC-barrel domain